MNNKSTIIILALCFLFGFAISHYFFPNKEIIRRPININSIVRDTTVKLIKQEPIIINQVKTKIIKQVDTVIKTYPFIARLDTIIKHDTVFAEYEFPQNLFSLKIKQKPDSLLVQKETLFEVTEKERPWWETPAYIIGGTLVGYLLGSAVK